MKRKNEKITPLRKEIGKNIKRIRTEKVMTIDEISQNTSIRAEYLKKIEKGEAVKVSIKHLLLIAEALNVKITDFF